MTNRPTERADAIVGRRAERQLRRKRRWTYVSLAYERLVPLLWPPFGLALLFVALSLLDVWSRIPGWAHLAAICLFALAILVLLGRAVRRFAVPSAAQVRDRLERSGGQHRPLTTIEDSLAIGRGDAATDWLWLAHRRRMAAQIDALNVPSPDPEMARRDPHALRLAVLMLLAFGLAVGLRDSGPRLQAALFPSFGPSAPADQTVLEAWVTPPSYTGMAPVFVSALGKDRKEPLPVPVGSRFLARFHGDAEPDLLLDGKRRPFERIGERDRQIEQVIRGGDQIAVMDGDDTLAAWPIRIIPDEPPTVSLADEPRGTIRGALRLAYEARDDYALKSVVARIVRTDGKAKDKEIVLDLPLPGRQLTEAKDVQFRDLSAHPWAGLPVELTLEAQDAAGQTGLSKAVRMILPAREFKEPAARAVIELRQRLNEDPKGNRDWVTRAIKALQINPKLYHEDFAVHVMLSMIRTDLVDRGDEPETIQRSQQALWETALRIEEGNVSTAQERLRQVQKELMEALANGASEEEIQRLMDELQQAMDEYLRAMQQEAMRRLERGEELPNMDNAQTLERQNLEEMLDQARELSRSGARDQARQMLSQLQQMLENLQMGAQSGPSQAQQQAEQLLDRLGRMMEQQQRLRDETFSRRQRREQPGSQLPSEQSPFSLPGRNRFGRSQNMDQNEGTRGGNPGQPGDQDLAGQQGDLRRQLGELMRRLDEALGGFPQELGEAERSMRGAEGALQGGDSGEALTRQGEALDRLRRGTESVMQDLAERGEGRAQNQNGPGRPGMDGEETDPLGRAPTDSWGDGTGDMVPDKSALQRSREILDELRRRSGQRYRGETELDYILRLLRQF